MQGRWSVMKMKAVNKKLRVGKIAIRSVSSASLVQFGDADVLTSSSVTDTPADSLILGPLPLQPPVAPKNRNRR